MAINYTKPYAIYTYFIKLVSALLRGNMMKGPRQIYLVQDMDKWRDLVDMVIKPQVKQNAGSFLTR